jgi:choline-sulfatase
MVASTTQRNRPNLLYIHSDQHNPFVTGCYGDPLVRTPNLDRLAANGIVFDNVYCPSPICLPSRMATLTGHYPHQLGTWVNADILSSSIPTMAHAMGAAGYKPVLIGRMHSIGPDQLRGYSERYLGDHRPNFMGGTPVDHGDFEGTQDPTRVSLEKSGSGQSAYQVMDEHSAAKAVEVLNGIGLKRKFGLNDEPFSLTVGLMLPHQPFIAREEDYEIYRGKVPPPRNPEPYSDRLHPRIKQWRELTGITDVTQAETNRARTAYWALVDRLDKMIGQILDALYKNGLAENTLIIYSSDHGEQLGEHGLWWKHTFYESSVRIPLIVSWPGVIPAGKRRSNVVSSLDMTATMLDALGAPALPGSSGRSLLRLMREPDGEVAWNNEAFSEYCSDNGYLHRMIRRDEWKLNFYYGLEPQLFNLREDPHELHDRAADPACQKLREELTARVLDGWNPEEISTRMAVNRNRNRILYEWARETKPEDRYRWPLSKEMHFLNEESKE